MATDKSTSYERFHKSPMQKEKRYIVQLVGIISKI